VKRKVALVAGIAALLGGLIVGARLTAQAQQTPVAAPAAPLATRVRVMNLPKAIKDYEKFTMQQNEIKAELQKLDEPMKKLQAEIQTEMQGPFTNAQAREAAENDVGHKKLQLQGMNADREKAIAKKTAAAMETLFKDVEGAVLALSRARGYEMVLYYNDALDAAEKYNPQVLNVKLSASGMPIYTAPGLDITAEVVQVLNFNLHRDNTSTPAGATGGGNH
jgi:Skp family chaperone for outer membrane proteins